MPVCAQLKYDDVNMNYCCKRIKKPQLKSANELLPHRPLQNTTKPDMTKIPFYCYMLEDAYTGYPQPRKSSLKWFAMMAQVAGISKKCNTAKDYITAIRMKSKHLCMHRNEQKIEILQNYNAETKRFWIF